MAFLPPLPDEPVILPSMWIDIWKMALTRPSVETFTQLAHAPTVSSRRAHVWVFLAALAGSIVAGIFSISIGVLLGTQTGPALSPLDLLLLSPLVALFSLALFVISVGTGLTCAHALGGKGIYMRLAYTMAMFVSPLLIIGSMLSALPLVNVTNILIVGYGAWLSVVAIQGITHLSRQRAALAVLLTLSVLALLLAGFIIATLPLFIQALQK